MARTEAEAVERLAERAVGDDWWAAGARNERG